MLTATPSWINLVITNTRILFEPADRYLGLSVKETTERIAEVHPDCPDIAVCCIGQSGENLVKYAGVFCSTYHTAARCGLGAVLGSKKVKAVCCFGRDGLEMADQDAFLSVTQGSRDSIASIGRCAFYKAYGTPGGMIGLNETHTLPVRNFQKGHMDDVYPLSGQALVEQGNVVRLESWLWLHHILQAIHQNHQKLSGQRIRRPGIRGDFRIRRRLRGLRYRRLPPRQRPDQPIRPGLHLLRRLHPVGHGMRGTGGIARHLRGPCYRKTYKLAFGNADAMLALIDMIAFRRGYLGNLLAEGVREAAKIVGHDSWKWAIEAKGLEQSRVETRNAKGYALSFATNPRGPDHLYGQMHGGGRIVPGNAGHHQADHRR